MSNHGDFDPCPNCSQTTHVKCCVRCGKVLLASRLFVGADYCTAKCEQQQQREDRISAAIEANEQAGASTSTEPSTGSDGRSRLTAKQRRRRALLAWRWCTWRPLSAEKLEMSFTCEELPDFVLPERHYRALVEFRHLTRKARLAACRRFLMFDRTHDPSCSYHVRVR